MLALGYFPLLDNLSKRLNSRDLISSLPTPWYRSYSHKLPKPCIPYYCSCLTLIGTLFCLFAFSL